MSDVPLHRIRSKEIPVAEAELAAVHVEMGGLEISDSALEANSKKGSMSEGETAEILAVYPDGGWQAWGVVFACFTYAATQMGYTVCFGVFGAELSQTYYPNTSLSVLNLTSGLCNGEEDGARLAAWPVAQVVSPSTVGSHALAFFTQSNTLQMMMGVSFIFGRFGEVFGHRRLILIGAVSVFIAFVISAVVFKYSVALLLIFQGLFLGFMFGIGQALYMSIPSMWFLKRRGLATGVAVAGSGFGGAIGVLISRGLLPRLGYQNTLITYGGIGLFLNLVTFPLLRVRNPYMQVVDGELEPVPEMTKVLPNWLPEGVWRDSAFYAFSLSYFISLFGYLCPFLYLTPYTASKNPSFDPHSLKTAMPLFLTSIGLGLGRAFAGQLTDLFGPVNMLFLTYFIGGVLQVVMWPLCTTYSQINAFGFLYGFLGCNFLSLLPVAAAQMFGVRGLATLTGFVTLWCVPGQLAGGTIGGVVLSESKDYRNVAYYAGCMSFGAAAAVGYARLKRQKKLLAIY